MAKIKLIKGKSSMSRRNIKDRLSAYLTYINSVTLALVILKLLNIL